MLVRVMGAAGTCAYQPLELSAVLHTVPRLWRWRTRGVANPCGVGITCMLCAHMLHAGRMYVACMLHVYYMHVHCMCAACMYVKCMSLIHDAHTDAHACTHACTRPCDRACMHTSCTHTLCATRTCNSRMGFVGDAAGAQRRGVPRLVSAGPRAWRQCAPTPVD